MSPTCENLLTGSPFPPLRVTVTSRLQFESSSSTWWVRIVDGLFRTIPGRYGSFPKRYVHGRAIVPSVLTCLLFSQRSCSDSYRVATCNACCAIHSAMTLYHLQSQSPSTVCHNLTRLPTHPPDSISRSSRRRSHSVHLQYGVLCGPGNHLLCAPRHPGHPACFEACADNLRSLRNALVDRELPWWYISCSY